MVWFPQAGVSAEVKDRSRSGQGSVFVSVYGFGPFVLDTVERRLTRDDAPVALAGKAFEALEVLVAAGGRLVPREALYEQLWPDIVVEERTLTVHVSTLRKILSGDGDIDYIETVPRAGYRLAVPVRALPTPEEPVNPASTRRRFLLPATFAALLVAILALAVLLYEDRAPTVASRTGTPAVTLAVLPFAALDLPEDDRFLGLGIADAVITQLSGLPRLGVRPTSAVLKVAADADPGAMGSSLLVTDVLEGAIQRDGDRLRISVRLVDTETGTARWGENFEQPVAGVFELQDAIARRVASILLPRLAAEEAAMLQTYRPRSAEAYRLQLRARVNLSRFERGPAFEAVAQFQQAVALDPDYARAYAGLASAYAQLTSTLVTRALSVSDGVRLAREAAEAALALDSALGEAHTVLADLRFLFDWDWAGAEEAYRHAVAVAPNDAETLAAYGWFLSAMSRHDESLTLLKRARQLDPLRRDNVEMLGFVQWMAGDAEQGLATLAEASALDPAARRPYFRRMLILDGLGRRDQAMAERAQWLQRFDEAQWARDIVEVQHAKGYRVALEPWLAMLDRLGQPYELAMQWMALDEPQKALAGIARCLEIRCASAPFLRAHPSFRTLHGDPRFEAHAARLKLPVAGPS